MTYIATFFSHYGAMRFRKLCECRGFKAALMPVPRDLSSSCGSCVCYEGAQAFPSKDVFTDVEQIVLVNDGRYTSVYRADDEVI